MDGHLSARAHARACAPALPYFKAFMDAQQRPWSPDDPEGNLILTVAENKLSSDLIHARLSEAPLPPPSALQYADMRGIPALRKAWAETLMSTFMKGHAIDPDHITCSAGAGAILDMLFFCVCSAGDGVLIPAPYYPAFDNDLQVRNSVVPVPLHLDDDGDLAAQLDAAAVQSAAAGHPIKALLFTNPSNPQGIIFSRKRLDAFVAWCLPRGIHLISDEIYGNSVFGPGARFDTILNVLAAAPQHAAAAENLLHVVFGLSKDFSASGLRMGCLYSRNAPLNNALGNLGYFAACSGHTQWAVANMLGDAQWLAVYLEENNRRLRASYDALSQGLAAAGVPFVPACASMFCWVDLRAALPEASWAGEQALWQHMVSQHHLLLTPGQTCHATEPGFFRICWAWAPTEAMPEAARRIGEVLRGDKNLN